MTRRHPRCFTQQAHQDDVAGFIQSFTGSNRFVMDYLVEEVLHQQPENVQTFLLQPSILDRLCGPLCEAVVRDPATSGQATLELLERANLFIVPLDDERRWYRYHQLFADLLRQRLHQSDALLIGDAERGAAEYHRRASQWYEDNNLEMDAFHHATAANDIPRAERLMAGGGMPLHFRGAVAPVLNWLASLPTTVLNARPTLWVMYASALSMTGQLTNVEEKLQGVEAALQGHEPDNKTRNLIGHIAAVRAFLAAVQNQVETIIVQSQRALEYLHPDNLPVRTATIWKLGIAYQLQGNRTAAGKAYAEAIANSQASGNIIVNLSARIGLGQVQEMENELHSAAETYYHILELVGNPSQPTASAAHLGLARIHYQWNDLDVAQQHARLGLVQAEQTEQIDNPAACQVFLARLNLAQGDVDSASALLVQAEQFVRRHNFVHRMPDIVALKVLTLLRQSNLVAAAQLAQTHDLPVSQARVLLAQGDPLALAEPSGFVRVFVDEDAPMARLLSEVAQRGIMPAYTSKLLAAFEVEPQTLADRSPLHDSQPTQILVDPLSERELDILGLIVAGLKNQEIADQLIISLNTALFHSKNIYGKLGVNKRALAIAKARELELIYDSSAPQPTGFPPYNYSLLWGVAAPFALAYGYGDRQHRQPHALRDQSQRPTGCSVAGMVRRSQQYADQRRQYDCERCYRGPGCVVRHLEADQQFGADVALCQPTIKGVKRTHHECIDRAKQHRRKPVRKNNNEKFPEDGRRCGPD